MKKITTTFAFFAISCCFLVANAQKVKTTSGNPEILKSETTVNIEFVYDNISVGKYKNEPDYIKAKTEEYNNKQAGTGDTWATKWKTDKANRFEPKFIELFTINSGMITKKDAKYTIIFKTLSMEPGFNVGVMRKNAEIDAEVWIVETDNPDKKVCTLTINNVPGGTAFGYDFDTGLRISEAYANAGKKLGKYLK